jgi:prophage regulatory protein
MDKAICWSHNKARIGAHLREQQNMEYIMAAAQHPPRPQTVKLLSREDLKRLGVNYSNVHLLRLEEDGKFPKRLYLSPARVAWIEFEIDVYIAGCIAAR